MGKEWTAEQKQVIDLENRSLLVSAAAGSGKTAVLVERIIRKITKGAHPLDIDQLLVVTFTKAAAAEMRERVMAAVEKGLEAEPENLHLQKQKMLLPSAMITTIDSFCMHVLREHFDAIDLDPGFRVGNPQEMTLLKQDVVKKLLEDYYEKEDPNFIQFIDTYASGRLDRGIGDWILKIYDFSQSHPWPELWLERALNLISGDYTDAENPVLLLVMEESRRLLEEIGQLLNRAYDLALNGNGPALYEPMLAWDMEQIEAMGESRNFDELEKKIHQMEWKRLSGKKQPEADPSVTEQVKNLRQEAKDLFGWLKTNYFSESLERIGEREKEILPGLKMLVTLAGDFHKAFQTEKRNRNLIDFSDQEHMALMILLGENHEPTAVAREYQEQFEEIMCDEYQDSNLVQETLLTSISRNDQGQPNVFMVGDVKQSIYRFRMAEPEIFLEKYETYEKAESLYQRIDLHKNFRSRACVLDSINQIFKFLMTQEICGMVYDRDAALYPGLAYPEWEGRVSETAEWILMEHENQSEVSKREAEAWAVGRRIRELTAAADPLYVMDPEEGQMRPVTYGDIVILLRTVKGWAEDYVRVLKEMGIPAIAETSAGFFDTLEIQGILNMLRILDNPLQDIPMAAVLRSAIGGFTDEELARIRVTDRSKRLYDNLQFYIANGEEDALREKLAEFTAFYEGLRRKKVHVSIEELIYEIYEQTGYVQRMSAMPGGDVRRANLERLLEYAREFLNTSYRGLFHFIRYVDELKEAKEDIGEMVLTGDEKKAVRIMSIHKSKGLEFPVCFVAGLGKNMNFTETRSRIVVHARHGIAGDGVDLSNRVKIRGFAKKVFARKLLQDQMGEEVRVLYVALTRAREKLILVGTVEHMEQTAEKWALTQGMASPVTYSRMIRAKSYLDWIGPLLWSDGRQGKSFGFRFTCWNMAHRALDGVGQEILDISEKNVWMKFEGHGLEDSPIYKRIEEKLSWCYPGEVMTRLHGKMTVSDLKKMTGEAMVGEALYTRRPQKTEASLENPLYVAQQKGTATHKIFELLPFDQIHTEADVVEFIHQCVLDQRIPEFWETLIPAEHLYEFCQSDLGRRMAEALRNGKLYRERPFVMGLPVNEIYPELSETASILIQGVIDVFFEEMDGVVLLDYKTDRIPEGKAGEAILVSRYKGQLDYYQRAIEQITGKKVKDRILYSVIMNKAIHC